MHSRPCHALMSEPFSMILFENKHNTWLLRSILLKHRCKSSFIQNYTKIKICVFIAVKYIFYIILSYIIYLILPYIIYFILSYLKIHAFCKIS